MAKQKNEFREDEVALLDALAELQYLSHVTGWMVDQAVRIGQKTLEKHKAIKADDVVKTPGFLPEAFGVASSLIVNDLFGNEGAYFPHRPMMAADKKLLDLIDELGGRLQAQCLAMAYEVLETFFKRVGGKLYFHKRGKFVLHKKKLFHRKYPEWNTGQHRGTPPYYAAYANWLCNHNSDELLADLRDEIPEFEKVAENNWRTIDLFAFYRAVSFSRHTIVHHGGVPHPARFSRLGKEEQQQVKGYMRKSVSNNEETILPSNKQVSTLIDLLATLGHVLYRTASDACDMAV